MKTLKDIMLAIDEGWDISLKDDAGSNVIDRAIDYRNWMVLHILLRCNIHRSVVIHSIGELLASYDIQQAALYDRFILALVHRCRVLEYDECKYLLHRACDGLAWYYVMPLALGASSEMGLPHNSSFDLERTKKIYTVLHDILHRIPKGFRYGNYFFKAKKGLLETQSKLSQYCSQSFYYGPLPIPRLPRKLKKKIGHDFDSIRGGDVRNILKRAWCSKMKFDMLICYMAAMCLALVSCSSTNAESRFDKPRASDSMISVHSDDFREHLISPRCTLRERARAREKTGELLEAPIGKFDERIKSKPGHKA